jgi:hypothetical protein
MNNTERERRKIGRGAEEKLGLPIGLRVKFGRAEGLSSVR